MLEALVVELSAQVFLRLLREAKRRFDDTPLEAAANRTAAQHPEYANLEHALRLWLSSTVLQEMLKRFERGEMPDVDTWMVQSFVDLGGFYAGAATVDVAAEILSKFLTELRRALLRGPEAHIVLAGSQEREGAAIRAVVEEHSAVRQIELAERESLDRLVRWSDLAERDAASVLPDGREGRPLDLDDLYVPRSVEERIRDALSKGGSSENVHLLRGEAGMGKTSTMWHLSRVLRDDGYVTLFLKANLLTSTSAGGGTMSPSDIVRALGHVDSRRPAVVLVDTIDVLLHEDVDRALLTELLGGLMGIDVNVIAAIRPREVALLDSGIPIKPYFIGAYDEVELKKAIETHVEHFYRDASDADLAEVEGRIRGGVSKGLPVREVCLRPLTLRMLFSLYSEDQTEIPLEINVFGLYRRYWQDRVRRDVRAGSAFPYGPDVSSSAMAAALVMVQWGQPEVDAESLRESVSRFGGEPGELEMLADRGVIYLTSLKTARFFHQTFFEHAAARAFVSGYGGEGFDILRARFVKDPEDMFLGPIVEQALLLAERATPDLAGRADKTWLTLLAHPSSSAQATAVSAYGFRDSSSDEVARKVRSTLAEAGTALVGRFLDVAPNTPQGRFPHLFQELEAIWRRDRWAEQQRVIWLIGKLAAREPAFVKAFITELHLVDFVLDESKRLTAVPALADAIAGTAAGSPTWSLESLLSLLERSLPLVASRDLARAILTALHDHSDYLQPETLAERVEAWFVQSVGSTFRGFEQLPGELGRLWLRQWQLGETDAGEVVKEISGLSDGLPFRARLKGLAALLLRAPVQQAEVAWEMLRNEKDPRRRQLVTDLVLIDWVRGGPEGAERTPAPESVEWVRTAARRAVLDQLDGTPASSTGGAEAARAFMRAALSPLEFLDWRHDDRLRDVTPWLDVSRLGPLIGPGYLANIDGATKAFDRLVAETDRHERTATMAGTYLRQFASDSRDAFDAVMLLTTRRRDSEGLSRLVASAVGAETREWANELREFINRLLVSPEGRDRRRGLHVWDELIRYDVLPPPAVEDVSPLVEDRGDKRVGAKAVTVLGQHLSVDRHPLEKVRRLLSPHLDDKIPDLAAAARWALTRALVVLPSDPTVTVDEAVATALTPPPDTRRISVMRDLMARLLPANASLATGVFLSAARAAGERGAPSRGRANLASRFRIPLREALALVSPEERDQLLRKAPTLHPTFSRMVVGLFAADYSIESAARFDEILRESKDDRMKEIIRRGRIMNARIAGGKTWPELHSDLVDRV